MCLMGSRNSGYETKLKKWKSMADGATPNVTTSAKESNSFPMGEDTFNKRAVIPSKKSKTAPIIMKMNAP